MVRRLLAFVFVVLLFSTILFAQLQRQSVRLREAAKENELAKIFENARRQAGAKHLNRIEFRNELQELVCTAAINDRAPMYSPGVPALGSSGNWHPELPPPSALYKTTEPDKITDELERLAKLDPMHKQAYKRFSVAVWRSAKPNEKDQYWVGIQFYWSAAMEFFDYHFTDDIRYHNEWKKTVAPECRNS